MHSRAITLSAMMYTQIDHVDELHASSAVQIRGVKPPPTTLASWKLSEAPEYRTRVSKSSANKAATGPATVDRMTIANITATATRALFPVFTKRRGRYTAQNRSIPMSPTRHADEAIAAGAKAMTGGALRGSLHSSNRQCSPMWTERRTDLVPVRTEEGQTRTRSHEGGSSQGAAAIRPRPAIELGCGVESPHPCACTLANDHARLPDDGPFEANHQSRAPSVAESRPFDQVDHLCRNLLGTRDK